MLLMLLLYYNVYICICILISHILVIEFNDEKLILEKIVFFFGRSMRHLSSLAWDEVDFILWPARFTTFRQAATNGTIRILSFQIQQTDQTQMLGFEQLFDIIGTDLK